MSGRTRKGVEADSHCFVCGQLNEKGLQAIFTTDSEHRKSQCTITLPSEYQGWANVVHGGILSTLLDEACIYACRSMGEQFVTASLTVKFRKPVALGTEMLVTGELIDHRKRLWVARAQIHVAGELHAEATAKVFALDDRT